MHRLLSSRVDLSLSDERASSEASTGDAVPASHSTAPASFGSTKKAKTAKREAEEENSPRKREIFALCASLLVGFAIVSALGSEVSTRNCPTVVDRCLAGYRAPAHALGETFCGWSSCISTRSLVAFSQRPSSKLGRAQR